ncbi:MAG: Zn-dependent hydrolase [Chloroflexi bacterium]|nr:Zn-dependent hydrolase [Chloroflexota bacterium]
MRLRWYGHASFLITASNGTKIVTDPYTPETSGYAPVQDEADIVITSSDNDRFHCRGDLIPGQPIIVNALEVARQGGSRIIKGITFQAIEAMEALDHREHDPDQNGMYRFQVDGIEIGHIGDVGNAFSKKQLQFFEGIDVFLALAGGHPTIELDELKRVIDHIQPRLVVPMHFRTLTYKLRNIYWIERFLEYFDDGDIDFASHYEVALDKANLPAKTRVLVVDHVR